MKKLLLNILWIGIMLTILLGSNLFAKSSFSGERLKNACLNYIERLVEKDAEIRMADIEDQYFEETGVIARCDIKSKDLRGNTYIAVEFLDHKEEMIRRLEVPVSIRIYRDVPTAVHALQRGHIVQISDITYKRLDVTYQSEQNLPGIEKIVGKKLKRNISTGDLITSDYLEQEILVNRGGKVDIIVRSGAVKIRTSGVALQDAGFGDNIRVQRDGSRQSLMGKVDINGTVLINTR